MNTQGNQDVEMAVNFIEQRAPRFHSAFGAPSRLNQMTMEYEPEEIHDLRETLEYHWRAGKYVDFTTDLKSCTWDDVHGELARAQAAADESARRGKQIHRKIWRSIGSTSSVLAPGLAAIPDELNILHGGLALVFSLARHSEMNRLKILDAFQNVPNIIEMARNKAETFPLDDQNPKSVKLHQNVHELRTTLVRALPPLINKIAPSTSLLKRLNFKAPFGALKIDQILDGVSLCAESVRACAESLVEEVIVGNYAATISIQSQLGDLFRQQREILMSINADNSKTHLLQFLMEQINVSPNALGFLVGPDQTDMSDMGTAPLGYTPEDLLICMDVNHLRIAKDASMVGRRGSTFSAEDNQRAAHMVTIPQIQRTMASNSPSMVAVDGHFERAQMGKISPLSYMCSMLAQALRQPSPESTMSSTPGSPASPRPDIAPCRRVVLEYYCSLHAGDGSVKDDLCGPQGLMRSLVTQLVLSLVANGWMGQDDALHLPHIRDIEEDILVQRRLELAAVCRLFAALTRCVPQGVPVHCFIDGWSAYEREGLWEADYDVVLDTLRGASDASSLEAGANLKVLVTSPTKFQWLAQVLPPDQKVSLRSTGGNWRGAGRGGLLSMARAATSAHVNGGFGSGLWMHEGAQSRGEENSYDRRSEAQSAFP